MMASKILISTEEIGRLQDLGLGRGLDATNPKPWLNKSSFQVRKVRLDNLIGTDEGGTVQSYEHEISSVQTQQANMKTSIVVPQSPVSIGTDGEMSRSVSTTRIAIGKKVVNRTISFRADFEDVPLSHISDPETARESSISIATMQRKQRAIFSTSDYDPELTFEERLAKWILQRIQQHRDQEYIARKLGRECHISKLTKAATVIGEIDTKNQPLDELANIIQSGGDKEMRVVVHACFDFIRHFRITHYVCAIEVGAAEYKVMTETNYRNEMGIAGSLGVDKVVDAALSGKLSFKRRTKSTDVKKIGMIQSNGKVERGTHEEAVVGIKILPIVNLVSLRVLHLALQKALLDFFETQSDKSGECLMLLAWCRAQVLSAYYNIFPYLICVLPRAHRAAKGRERACNFQDPIVYV